jgi:hypothetical protein
MILFVICFFEIHSCKLCVNHNLYRHIYYKPKYFILDQTKIRPLKDSALDDPSGGIVVKLR